MKRNIYVILSILIVNYSINARIGEDDILDHSVYVKQTIHPMRILFVVGQFPLLPETTILNQITGFIDRGHIVSIYAMQGKGYTKKMHADVKNYDLMSKTYFRTLPPDLSTYDIIYCQFGPLGKKMVAIKKQYNLKAKIVTCFRGYDMMCFTHGKSDKYVRLFEQGDLFLPVCDYFRRKLIKNGCPPEKVIVQHSAINCSLFKSPDNSAITDERIRLISVCRLVEKKGPQYAIRAVAALVKRFPQIEYTIVGDGPLMRRMRCLIRMLRADRNIKLIGWAVQSHVVELLNRSHICILPSVTARDGNEEGIPNALKEAMAMSKPVVSTYCAGIDELVDNEVSGYLVAQRDVKELERKIAILIRHPELRIRMGQAARKKVEEEFNVEIMNNRLELIFKKLLGRID